MALRTHCLLIAAAGLISGCAAEGVDEPAPGSNSSGGSTSTAGSTTGGTPTGGTPGTAGSTSTGGTGATTPTGGTPGSGGTPGTAGTGGTPAGGTCTPLDPSDLLANFDGGVAHVEAVAGRDGSWFQLKDTSPAGVITPPKVEMTPLPAEAGGACTSAFGYHTTATGFVDWGAGVAAHFIPRDSTSMLLTAYDLSAYTGIALWAKAGTTITANVSISNKDTATMDDGVAETGACNKAAAAPDPTRCGDHFGKDILIGADWQEFVIPFATMSQKGWGAPAVPLDLTKTYTLRIKVKGDFDLWIDEVRFTH